MSKPSGFGLAMVAAGAVASLPAAATPVTITHSVTLNTLMQGSGSSTLQFDLNSFLSSEGYNPTEVIGGTVSVFGFSEASYAAPQYGYANTTSSNYAGSHLAYYSYYVSGYSYSCGWGGWSTCYSSGYTATGAYYVADYNVYSERDVLHTDAVADQMRVTTGNTVSTATASGLSSSTGPYGGYAYTGSYGGGTSSIYYYYNRDRDVYSAVYGNLALTQALDSTALIDLSGDGSLGMSFGAPLGQYRLNEVSFDLVVQQALAGQSLGGGEVPEPSDLPLTALALGAALATGHVYRRRRAKR
jgi:hypothetical protein